MFENVGLLIDEKNVVYSYADACINHNDATIKTSDTVLLEKYTSHFIKAMNCGIVVREFVLQSRYYVHFRANTLGKGMNPLILPPDMVKK